MSADRLNMTVITTDGEFDQLRPGWDSLHAAADGPVFQTFSWNRIWWDIYPGQNDRLRIAVVCDGSTCIGLLPAYLMSTRLGPVTIVQLRFIGTSDTYGEYGPLVLPGREDEVADAFAEFCSGELAAGSCDVVSLFRYAPGSPVVKRMLGRFREMNLDVSDVPEIIPRMVMKLPATWEEYLQSLSEGEQKILHRRTRALLRRGVRIEIVNDFVKDPTAFPDFVDLHTRAWDDEGLPGYYRNSPRFREFHERYLSGCRPDGSARIYFMKCENVRFAAVQAFFAGPVCCFYLSGMDRHHALANQSPGKVLLSIVVGDAIRSGCTLFDFQGGDEDYKRRLGGEMTSFARALVWMPGRESVKVGILRALQSLRYFLVTVIYGDVIARFSRRLFRLARKR